MSKRRYSAEVGEKPTHHFSKRQVVARLRPCLKVKQCSGVQPTEPVNFLPLNDLRKPWNSKQGADHRRHVLHRLATAVESSTNSSTKREIPLAKERLAIVSFQDNPLVYRYEHSRAEVQAMFGQDYDIDRYGTSTSELIVTGEQEKETHVVDEPDLKKRLRRARIEP